MNYYLYNKNIKQMNTVNKCKCIFFESLHHFKGSFNFRKLRFVLSIRSQNSLVTPNPARDND